MTQDLPDGFRVRVGDEVRVHDGGRTLVGGSPLRVLRLRAPAPSLGTGSVVEVRDAATRIVAERLLAARQKELHILQRACLDHLNEMVC